MTREWIVIPNWTRYQHYRDRAPAWIKDHLSQLNDDEYIELTFAQRGLLSGLRLQYAASDGRLPKNTLSVSSKLGQRVTERQLNALRDAGFIRFVASRPLSLTRARERALEEKILREEKNERAKTTTREKAAKQQPRPSAGAYQPAIDHLPNVEVDERMLELAKGWLKP